MNFGIIAAGEGSRLVGEGITEAKPLVEINGVPMIGRLLRLFGQAGASLTTVVTNAEHHDIAEYIDSITPSLPFPVIIREARTPSSMHTFAILADMLKGKGRFIATTVDTVFGKDIFLRYVEAFGNAPDSVDALMGVTSYIEDEKPLYVDTDKDMNILAFRDSEENPLYISAGVYGLDDKVFPVLESCIRNGVHRMRNFQRAMIDSGLHLKAFDIGKAIDVDHSSDIAAASQIDSDHRHD